MSHYDIIKLFNSKLTVLKTLIRRRRYVVYLLQTSCAYTLARKYKLKNYSKAFTQFGVKLTCPTTKAELKI